MIQAFVVGGGLAYVKNHLTDHLHSVGIDIGSHWSWEKARPPNDIPIGCDLVIILKDDIGHSLSEPTEELAKRKNTRFVRIDRKWSVAKNTLIAKKIVGDKVSAPAVTAEKVYELLFDAVKEMREKGRTPEHEEVDALFKEEFGGTTRLPWSEYRRLLSETAPFLKKADERLREALASRSEMTVENAKEAVRIVLSNYPEYVLDTDYLAEMVCPLMKCARVDSMGANIRTAITDEAMRVRAQWMATKSKEGTLNLIRLKKLAARNIWNARYTKGESLPITDKMGDMLQELFGTGLAWESLKQAKEDFLRTRNLVEVKKGVHADGFMKVISTEPSDAERLATVKATVEQVRALTSVVAPVPTPEPPKVPLSTSTITGEKYTLEERVEFLEILNQDHYKDLERMTRDVAKLQDHMNRCELAVAMLRKDLGTEHVDSEARDAVMRGALDGFRNILSGMQHDSAKLWEALKARPAVTPAVAKAAEPQIVVTGAEVIRVPVVIELDVRVLTGK